jgi:hypothetical protein
MGVMSFAAYTIAIKSGSTFTTKVYYLNIRMDIVVAHASLVFLGNDNMR